MRSAARAMPACHYFPSPAPLSAPLADRQAPGVAHPSPPRQNGASSVTGDTPRQHESWYPHSHRTSSGVPPGVSHRGTPGPAAQVHPGALMSPEELKRGGLPPPPTPPYTSMLPPHNRCMGTRHEPLGAFSHSARTARAQRAHSARTAPIITVIIWVTAPKTTHLRNHAQPIQISKNQTSDACHGSQGPKFCPL